MKNRISRKLIFFIIFLVAFLIRLYVSKMGNNFDYGSWKIVGSLVADGKNVYTQTTRYGYGPFWALALGVFKKLSLLFYNDLLVYRSLIILALSFADFLITILLIEYVGNFAILFFLFNPVSIYISGFHNQFDNVSIAVALCSFKLIEKYRLQLKGYLLLGFSLIIKHIFLFFPIWLFIRAKNNKERLLSVTPILFFLLSFVPFLFSANAASDIWKNVFIYQRDLLYNFLPKSFLTTPLIILCFIVPFGFLFRNEKIQMQGFLYLLIFIATLINSGGQYLAIPLAAYAAINPLIGLLYTNIALLNIVFNSARLQLSLIAAFQLSWLVFFRKYIRIFNKFFGFIIIVFSLILAFYSWPKVIKQSKEIYTTERKNIWFMQSLYPADKVFNISKEKAKKPLVVGNVVKGQFIAKQNNLGYVTIPFLVENAEEGFLDRGYKVTVNINEAGKPGQSFEETRTLHSALTDEGILLGFPLQTQSEGKKYEISIFTDVPKNKTYMTIDLTDNVQIRYFLSRQILNSPKKIVVFLFDKMQFFFLQKNTISLFLQFYSYVWLIATITVMIGSSFAKSKR